jgi:hypothetical protein
VSVLVLDVKFKWTYKKPAFRCMDFLPLIGRNGQAIASCKTHLHALISVMPNETKGKGERGAAISGTGY